MRTAQRVILSGAVLVLLGAMAVIAAGMSILRRGGCSTEQASLRLLPFLGLPVGSVVGFSSSGAGVLGTLVLMRFTGLAPAGVVGTDLAFGIALSTLGGGLHTLTGAWDGRVLILFSAGGVAGAAAGAWLSTRAPVARMRIVILATAFVLGLALLYTGVRTWQK